MAETGEIKSTDSKRTVVIIIITILVGANALLLWQYFEKKKYLEQITKTLEVTTSDKDQLAAELQKIKLEYEKINQDNADLHGQIASKDEEIKQKISEIQRLINNGDAEALRQARAELDILKSMSQKYAAQMDSLKSINSELYDQNTKLVSNLSQEQSKVTTLQQQNILLSDKVAIGSILKTIGLKISGIRVKGSGKELETTRASKVEKFKIDCTILENKVIDPGMRDVFVRVLSPDGAVMSTSQETFNYNGQATLFSGKETVDYRNADYNFTIYWTKGSAYAKGKYSVELYCTGNLIGTSFIELK